VGGLANSDKRGGTWLVRKGGGGGGGEKEKRVTKKTKEGGGGEGGGGGGGGGRNTGKESGREGRTEGTKKACVTTGTTHAGVWLNAIFFSVEMLPLIREF
jgi:hypothetical protein